MPCSQTCKYPEAGKRLVSSKYFASRKLAIAGLRRLVGGTAIVALGAGVLPSSIAYADTASVESFYKSREVKLIIHSTTGGAYDSWARLIAPYLSRHLPGKPNFVAVNMPGAGGIIAANHLYLRAPRDGSVIGMIGRNLPYQAVMGLKNIRFDPVRFNWLGSPEKGNTVFLVRGDAPVQTADELFEKQMLVGGAGAGTAVSLMPTILNKLLGAKFKLVEGYQGMGAIILAMHRNEVQGVFVTLTSVETGFPGGLKSGDVRILFNMEKNPVEGLNAPSIFKYPKSERELQLLSLLAVSSEIGRPMLAPPDVPTERVAALRKAFDAAMTDPELIRAAEKIGLPITSVTSGQELEETIRELASTSKALLEEMNQLSKL